MSGLFDQFKSWYEDRHDYAKAWKQKTGRQVVATMCTYTPEEVLIAAGMLPAGVAYVGALTLQRFYIDPAKPNAVERRSLWKNIGDRLGKDAKDPGGWDGETNVSQLQAIAEEA